MPKSCGSPGGNECLHSASEILELTPVSLRQFVALPLGADHLVEEQLTARVETLHPFLADGYDGL